MPSPIINDDELWSDLVQGSETAFSTLFKRHYPSLITYGRSITRHHHIVSDCIQDVFADIWLYRKKLSTPQSVKAYLLAGLRKRIARKLERDPIFRQSSGIEQVEFSAPFTILDQLITNDEMRSQVELLNLLLNRLSPRQKEALYLRFYQQLSVEEVADMMQMNYQSAANLLHRALKQLRSSWKGEIPKLMMLLPILFA